MRETAVPQEIVSSTTVTADNIFDGTCTVDNNNQPNNKDNNIATNNRRRRYSNSYYCEVCGDKSDGLHFGQYSCPPCAAFFRRTVALKLKYTCKRNDNCIINKEGRNMCRACRYQKCLNKGLQTSAVQCSSNCAGGKRAGDCQPCPDSSLPEIPADWRIAAAGVPRAVDAAVASLPHLKSMLEGYGHFLSMRKASYAIIQGPALFQSDDTEIAQSNFGNCKKLSRIEQIIVHDVIEKYLLPFKTVPPVDQNVLFDSFYCLFSNAERAYRSYRTFGPADGRLLMPDGGGVRLDELHKFYENNSIVVGDPVQVAGIFKNAMNYMLGDVVAHMRRIQLTEVELMALIALLVFKDVESLSEDGQHIVDRAQRDILIELHAFYRTLGLRQSEVTVKSANCLLLLPKIEQLTSMMSEAFDVAASLEMIDVAGLCPNLLEGLSIDTEANARAVGLK